MQLLRTLPGKPDWTDRSSYLPQWLNPRAGKMKRILHSDWLLERARPLRISRVGPARKSSLLGHTIILYYQACSFNSIKTQMKTSPISTLKIKKICFSPKVSIQLCRAKSDSALPGTIWAQFKPKQLNQKAIPAHSRAHFSPGTKSALANWTYWLWFKGAKLDSKKRTVFYSPKRPYF